MSVDSARQSLHPILYNRVGELVDEGHHITCWLSGDPKALCGTRGPFYGLSARSVPGEVTLALSPTIRSAPRRTQPTMAEASAGVRKARYAMVTVAGNRPSRNT